MRRQRYRVPDLVIGRRVLSICWLLAGMGIATLQMRLLAEAWALTASALLTACIASAWGLGAVLGSLPRLSTRTPLWSATAIATPLLALALSPLPWSLPGQVRIPANLLALACFAFILGLAGTAWLSQPRAWPAVLESIGQIRLLMCGLVGLVVTWFLPTAWSALFGLACLAPLVTLDCWPAGSNPFPLRMTADRRRNTVENWFDKEEGPGRWQLNIDRRASSCERWSDNLARRGILYLTLLASGTTIILGALWGAIPTVFAGDLVLQHELGKLLWLLGGLVCALLLGGMLLWLGRGKMGTPDRLLPLSWHPWAKTLALSSLLVMAASLAALGAPMLQAPWWLGVSFGCYTLAAACWARVLLRLRPGLRTIVRSYHHSRALFAGVKESHLAVWYAVDERIDRITLLVEASLTAMALPLAGWLIDQWTVDGLLLRAGVVLFLLFCTLGLACLYLSKPTTESHLRPMQAEWPDQIYRRGLTTQLPETERLSLSQSDLPT